MDWFIFLSLIAFGVGTYFWYKEYKERQSQLRQFREDLDNIEEELKRLDED